MKYAKPFIFSLAMALFILQPMMVTASTADEHWFSTFSLSGRPEEKPAGQGNQPYREETIRALKPFVLMDMGIASLKNGSADELRTSSSGFFLSLGGGLVFFKFFDVGVGFGVIFLKGKNPATDLTAGDEEPGSFAPFFYYAQAGVQVPIPLKNKKGLFPLWIGAHEGLLGVPAKREIAKGIDFDTEKRSFKARNYFQPEIKIQVAREIFIGVAYSIFCRCSDFKNKIMLFFSANFSGIR